MRLITAGLLIQPLVVLAAVQVFLYPSSPTSQHKHAPTLTPSQANAVLSHHLHQPIDDFDEIPQDESLWGHLVSMWHGDHENGNARVIIIDGGVEPQDVLPTTLPKTPSFYLPDDSSTRSLLAPYLRRAEDYLSHMLEKLPALAKSFKDIFEMAGTKAAALLGDELSCLTALADSLPWTGTSESESYEAISITGLKGVQQGGEVWETGRQGLKAGLEAMTQPDSPPLLLIIMPSTPISARSNYRTPQRRDNTSLADPCYASNETCSETTSCNGRGACALKAKTVDGECWGCKCTSGYAGVECQKDDYSVPFAILVVSTVMLFLMVVGSVSLLASVGETKLPSTLNLSVSGNSKRD
ncbi:hypothetical protein TREMEDRAFT_28666 [Tremella mesenterica DSM 1558]|uniref:uncharacterized protein n=1 Tax=Tremella mesenterica (strain ATCC 24925 / CBS 8224 / DSM 1558 / NBRC 9311 / NRRL Y-6157 / RJB 2259-6 / UBC 559-6) TaxID=578456 RepID=UPI0003F4A54C|nr:uncharacterized protein TREMEDRAFT_28666 [Tremella mesenterica DSM 1558]EIW70632.1 hypothetical protein TREMEDRAFT_28666 [Tremella mesenterica DSM 1558]